MAKRVAAETALALIHHGLGATPVEVAAVAGVPAGEAVAQLVDSDAESRGRVLYPQFVGVGAQAASLAVLVEQTRRTAHGHETISSRSLDIRLVREGEGWRVGELAAVGGPRVERPPDLSEEARLVSEHPRIHLPSSAVWDIYRGDVRAELLRLLEEVAERNEIHIVAFVSGRPEYVFGTNRMSNHARGRAVDIYAVNGVGVVEQRGEGSPAHALARWLYDLGVEEIGSPWDFDGPGGRSFTDAAHQDHIHVAVAP